MNLDHSGWRRVLSPLRQPWFPDDDDDDDDDDDNDDGCGGGGGQPHLLVVLTLSASADTISFVFLGFTLSNQTSFRTREQILNLRRVVLKLLPRYVCKCIESVIHVVKIGFCSGEEI